MIYNIILDKYQVMSIKIPQKLIKFKSYDIIIYLFGNLQKCE